MTASAAAPATGALPERADLAAWLAVAAGTIGAFMALLDISIVNAALPVIQGEIGATKSEGTWVGTAYLVAEIVAMPLTAWLERMLGLRRVLIAGSMVFAGFSVICGLSADLVSMVVGRVGQGLAGGVLIPTGLTILAKRLPARQQSLGMAIFAAAGLLGPILGPLVGGWLTDEYSWHFAFFINVPIGIAMILLVLWSFPKEKPDWSELTNADWAGIVGMALWLGAGTILLEEGHREQWFESAVIWQLLFTSLFGLVLVVFGQVRSDRPVLKLALLLNGSVLSIQLLVMVAGAVMFATLFLVPQFLVAIADYSSRQAGQIIFYSGVVAIFAVALYPALVAYVHVRYIVAAAMLAISVASFMTSDLTAETVGGDLIGPQLLVGIGLAFTMMPLQQAAVSAVAADDAGHVTSMFNISRNLGASIGLAGLAGFLDQRLEFHHWRLNSTLGMNDPDVQVHIASASQGLGGGPEGLDAALRSLDGLVMREALVMTFSDVFLLFGILGLIAIPLTLLLRPIDPERARGMMH